MSSIFLKNDTHSNSRASNTVAKNTIKGDSFTYAFGRINEAISDGYFLEAVTLAESVISDRLYSFVKHHESSDTHKLPSKEKKAIKTTNFALLIKKARRFDSLNLMANESTNMFDAIDQWRDERNKCVHSVAKSEPGQETISVDEFKIMAEKSAKQGKHLARMVCDWHRKQKKKN
jgi:hypothetical protein